MQNCLTWRQAVIQTAVQFLSTPKALNLIQEGFDIIANEWADHDDLLPFQSVLTGTGEPVEFSAKFDQGRLESFRIAAEPYLPCAPNTKQQQHVIDRALSFVHHFSPKADGQILKDIFSKISIDHPDDHLWKGFLCLGVALEPNGTELASKLYLDINRAYPGFSGIGSVIRILKLVGFDPFLINNLLDFFAKFPVNPWGIGLNYSIDNIETVNVYCRGHLLISTIENIFKYGNEVNADAKHLNFIKMVEQNNKIGSVSLTLKISKDKQVIEPEIEFIYQSWFKSDKLIEILQNHDLGINNQKNDDLIEVLLAYQKRIRFISIEKEKLSVSFFPLV